jgi:hypothetical protein
MTADDRTVHAAFPQPGVRQLALAYMSARDRADLIARGRFGTRGEGGSGPLRPGVTVDSRGLLVEQYTPESWVRHVRFHVYCREHGYPRRHEGVADGWPQRPSERDEAVTKHLVTWTQLKVWVTSGQTILFDEAMA